MPGFLERLRRPGSGAGEVTPENGLVGYSSFDGHRLALRPWPGERVCLLLRPDRDRDPAVLARILEALDAAHRYYAETSGRLPAPDRRFEGRDVIAEVGTTCGAGCSLIGASGMEIMRPYFDVLYQGVEREGAYDQLPFYELGRNFWFWSDQLAFKAPQVDPVVTGYAVWMRFRSIRAGGLPGGPFRELAFDRFQTEVEGLVGHYEAHPEATFFDTLGRGHCPWGYGGTDLWASLMMQLARRHGDQEFVTRFWHLAAQVPAAADTAGAVTNWVRLASAAAGTDLSPVFYDRWGFPRPDGRVSRRLPAEAVPEPG
ncbi:MAG TPA: hypothetical protein VEK76_10430 [Candidatus Binatia bacterium]|nr:hypothetical protein [Candidatus Binatia bacterium]